MNDILVATDGSQSGTAAVEEAIRMAARLGVGLTSSLSFPRRLVSSEIPSTSGASGLRDGHAAIEEALDRAAASGVPADGEIIEGDAADEVVALADNRDSSFIVLGSRGHGPLVGALLGSVSAGVVQHARRPVLIVNPGPPVEKRTTRAA